VNAGSLQYTRTPGSTYGSAMFPTGLNGMPQNRPTEWSLGYSVHRNVLMEKIIMKIIIIIIIIIYYKCAGTGTIRPNTETKHENEIKYIINNKRIEMIGTKEGRK
jgi:hypothetical protein